MSFRYGLAVGLLPLKRPPTKAVLLALAHHADEYTGECYPGLDRLMLFTALSKRAVRDAINEAEKLGYIKTVRGSGRTSTLYCFTLADAPPINQCERGKTRPSQSYHRAGRQEAPSEGQDSPSGEAPAAPELSKNYHKEEDALPRASLDENWWPDQQAWAALVAQFPNIDVHAETVKFIDRALASGDKYASPIPALRGWLKRAVENPKFTGQVNGTASGQGYRKSIVRAADIGIAHIDAELARIRGGA